MKQNSEFRNRSLKWEKNMPRFLACTSSIFDGNYFSSVKMCWFHFSNPSRLLSQDEKGHFLFTLVTVCDTSMLFQWEFLLTRKGEKRSCRASVQHHDLRETSVSVFQDKHACFCLLFPVGNTLQQLTVLRKARQLQSRNLGYGKAEASVGKGRALLCSCYGGKSP